MREKNRPNVKKYTSWFIFSPISYYFTIKKNYLYGGKEHKTLFFPVKTIYIRTTVNQLKTKRR